MKQDREMRILLLLCTLVLVFAGLYFARNIMAPLAFAFFVIAIAWPLQRALQAKIPAVLALIVTIVVTLALIAALAFIVVWGMSHVVEWLVNNTDRFQALYVQATEWLDGHGVSITSLVADSYNPSWMIGALREIGGRGYGLISFIVITFAFIVLGLLEVFVFQAEDGIRDRDVTGVQTCALPISGLDGDTLQAAGDPQHLRFARAVET